MNGENREDNEQRAESIYALRDALIGLLSWTDGGACSDCDMFRRGPTAITYQHHKDCYHLKDINRAQILLGREPEEGHDYDDPKAEMTRLANERCNKIVENKIIMINADTKDKLNLDSMMNRHGRA